MSERPVAPVAPGVDRDRLDAFALRVWGYRQGEAVALMVHLGDALGLYRAMAGAGPLDADAVAARTGLHPRWVLEWLRCQGAAGLLETADGERFELSAEGAEVLANESGSVHFAAGAFRGGAAPPEVVTKLATAFRTGLGLSYDELGEAAAHGVERMLGPWTRLVLVPVLIPSLEGMHDRLTAGADVVDVGCGTGVGLIALAAAYPASRFVGYDPSHTAITLAQSRAAAAGLTNVEVRCEPAAGLPRTPTYDLVLTLDCLHDMPQPLEAIAAIRGAIADDGTWLIKEIRSSTRWDQNLRNPMLALMYATSVAVCMSSGLSEPAGAGLGTLGLPKELLERHCVDAGFSRFATHDIGDPANLYYEVRP